MRVILARVIGGAALGAVLACSGMGLCWREVTLAKHDCCNDDGPTTTLVKPCAAPVAHENKLELAPPSVAGEVAVLQRAVDTQVAGRAAVSGSPATSRPAVLRI